MSPTLIVAAVAALALLAYAKRDELATLAVDVREFIKGLEGFAAAPYADDDHSTPDKIEYSYGYGHQLRAGETGNEDPEALLDNDIADAQRAIDRLVRVPLSPGQRAALVSFIFNIGASKFASSTLLRRLNERDYVGAASEFSRWVYAGGKVSNALVARREREKEIFQT